MDVLVEIERDLRAFADPATPVMVDTGSAVWEQNGRQLSIRLTRPSSGGLPDVEFESSRLTYRQFLASPHMADLSRLANYILKTNRPTENFIETSASWEDEDAGKPAEGPATDLIARRATEDLPFLSTRVVLVHGEAGSGKTIALRELTSRRAKSYEQGLSGSLFFYVDAQGRALSRLEDAMAKDLQDLRSRFSYAAIAPLTRHGLIIPIIDGFDELLGSGGYDEAFSSLAALLSLLEGRGTVIASARSAFFDYRNFRENATKFSGDGSLNYEVDVVKVLEWTDPQVDQYFQSVAASHNPRPEVVHALSELRQALDAPNRQLLSKPFYASRVATLVLEGENINSTDALIDQLVEAFLEREHKKLLDKQGHPLLSKKGHHTFLVQLAEEMWWQENRRIDVGTVQAVAEMVVETFSLPPGSARAIVERVSSYAFLSTDESERGALRFEHEVFYGYFLAHKLQECIEREPADLRRFLNRSVLDDILTEQATRLIGSDVGRCTRAVQSVCDVLRQGLSDVVARENAGKLIADIARSAGSLQPRTRIATVIFKQVSLGGVRLDEPRFERCDFDDVDLSHTVLVRPVFEDCALRHVIVDMNQTRFKDAEPTLLGQIVSLTVAKGDASITQGRVFAPEDISLILTRLGTRVEQPQENPTEHPRGVQQRLDVLDRFLRKMDRRFYASKDDLERFSFTRSPAWEEVLSRLRRHGLLEDHVIDKSGPRQPLIRLVVPPEILRRGQNLGDSSVPSDVRAFWRDVLKA